MVYKQSSSDRNYLTEWKKHRMMETAGEPGKYTLSIKEREIIDQSHL